ncbi:MAG TPA: methyltransferase [Pseudidiomarina sp.]|nr:methyltransferase [Pseudidiomarina sp.]
MPRSPVRTQHRSPKPPAKTAEWSRTAAPHRWDSPCGRLDLKRFPPRNNATLQAWDAGDSLLLERLKDARKPEHLLIINDGWGAILCGALQHLSTSNRTLVTVLTDSHLADLSYLQNSRANTLIAQFETLDPLAELPNTVDQVLMKLPKSQSLLERQLAQLSRDVVPGTPIQVAAKSQLFTPAVRELFEQYCTAVDVSLIQRKHRVLSARIQSQPWPDHEFQTTWQELGLTFTQHAGVFARNQLDIGARFMIEVMQQHLLPHTTWQNVADLGCGNGVLGLLYAQHVPTARVTWFDESKLAVASCQFNINQNLVAAEHYEVLLDDCLTRVKTSTLDCVLCNPPFHQEHAMTDHIAKQMIRDARRALKTGGELWLVGNRHLPYYQVLQKVFRQVDQIDQNSKFVVYRAS